MDQSLVKLQKLTRTDAQRFGQLADVLKGDVDLAMLNAAYIAARQAAL